MISKIRVFASYLQYDGLIPAGKKKSGLFSHRPDLLFCVSQSSCTLLHTKGQENKSKSASVSSSIYHCNEGQCFSCNQKFVPDVFSFKWNMW